MYVVHLIFQNLISEVTPKRIVMRKAILDANERKNAAKQAGASLESLDCTKKRVPVSVNRTLLRRGRDVGHLV